MNEKFQNHPLKETHKNMKNQNTSKKLGSSY